jgi:hypothetical protein
VAAENVGDQTTGGAVAQFPITTAFEFTEWPVEQSLGRCTG